MVTFHKKTLASRREGLHRNKKSENFMLLPPQQIHIVLILKLPSQFLTLSDSTQNKSKKKASTIVEASHFVQVGRVPSTELRVNFSSPYQ